MKESKIMFLIGLILLLIGMIGLFYLYFFGNHPLAYLLVFGIVGFVLTFCGMCWIIYNLGKETTRVVYKPNLPKNVLKEPQICPNCGIRTNEYYCPNCGENLW